MKSIQSLSYASAAIAACSFATACSSADSASQREATGSVSESIAQGSPAKDFPETALIDASMSGVQVPCSGTIISPHVVLTAATCLWRFGPWQVTAPYAGGQSVQATGGAVYDWSPINPTPHNIGVIFLPQPIALSKYPTLPSAPVGDGTRAIRTGRSLDGATSSRDLFASAPVALHAGAPQGFVYEYVASGSLDFSDMGGGVFLPDHTVVALNTNARENLVAMTRTDLVVNWLREQIQRAGDAIPAGEWVDMNSDPHACHGRLGAACGWNAIDNGKGYTCAPRYPGWAEPWTCEASAYDPNWINMTSAADACSNQAGKPCGWGASNNGEGYTCALRHPEWANGWTCEHP